MMTNPAERRCQAPHRVQYRRVKGWRMPDNTVLVSRPGRFGNPFRLSDWAAPSSEMDPDLVQLLETEPRDPRRRRAAAVYLHRVWLLSASLAQANRMSRTHLSRFQSALLERAPAPPSIDVIRSALAGKNLACHCRLDQACHADTLLGLANTPPQLGNHSFRLPTENSCGQTYRYRMG